MKRSIILLIFSVLVFGCQSMPHEQPYKQEATVLVDAQQQPGAAERFLVKATRFFRPSPSEMGDSAVDHSAPTTFSAAKPPYSQQITVDPVAMHVPVRQKSSIQASQMLFNFDLAENEAEESMEDTPSAEAVTSFPPKPAASIQKKSTKPNILQVQNGDSEQFQQLLKLIAKTPKDERDVDDAKLEQLLTKFRSDLEEMPDLEAHYLLALRKKILPNYQPQKKTSKPKIDSKFDEESEDESDEDYYVNDEEEKEGRRPAPVPPSKLNTSKKSASKYAKNTLNSRNTDPLEDDQEEAIESKDRMSVPPSAFPATSATATPLPPAQSKPLYPNLTQIDGAQSIVPAGYNSQYGNQFASGNIVHADYTNVLPSGINPADTKEWDSLVRMGADQLRYKIEQTPNGRTFANEGRLRLLETVLGNRNEAVKPIPGVDRPINEFMSNQMLGFTAFLDEVGTPDQRVRNVNALFRFDEGLMELRKICPIKLRRVQFVKDWQAFGLFIPRNEDCHAGEVLSVYMELENPTIRRTSQDFNVSASICYEIRDMSAKVIRKSEPMNVEESTPSQKRDYCVGLRVHLPDAMPPGSYQLRINVTDLNDETRQYAEEQIPFKVVPVVLPEN